ncbi:MAG: DUF1491 family protein [Alphaproteobacteria bacterium]|nr:DUF1491 family protein [Alphaproteobacteria bacterium]
MDARLPAYLEVSSLLRQVQSEGGFATVLHKGERDAGTILVVLAENGGDMRLYERMPQLDGTRAWTLSRTQETEKQEEFAQYLERRANQDPDTWVLELDIADGERFIAD